MTPNWVPAENHEALAERLADDIAEQISVSIAQRGRAVVALSGGSTPKPMFQSLCQRAIDWSSVIVTLVDERWVPTTNSLSNGAFLQSHLLSALPSTKFVPLYAAAKSAEDSLPAVLSTYAQATSSTMSLPAAFDVVILGMGEDGHTASFFPDASNIDAMLDPQQPLPLLSCESPSTQVPRITWSLPRLLDTAFLALHFTGSKKKAVYQQALENKPTSALPIGSILHQSKTPLSVYYAD